MKRDMELIRLILLAIEEQGETPLDWIEDFQIEGYNQKVVTHHVWLLANAGYLVAEDISSADEFEMQPHCLTWPGTEFLDAIRDPQVWQQTKAGAEKIGSFGVDVLITLAKGFIRKKIEDHTGVKVDL